MALSKSITLPNGAIGSYWKIVDVNIDRLNLSARFSIDVFCDQTHADNGSPSLGHIKTFLGSFTKDQLKGDIAALGYGYIKSQVAPYVADDGITVHPDIELEDSSDV